MDSKNSINDIAQKRFEELKKRFHLNQIAPVLPQHKQEQINNEVTTKDSIDKVIKETEARIAYSPETSDAQASITESKAKFVEDSFNFIESLNLPPQLSLAIGLIISGNKTDNIEDFLKAKNTLKEYILYKGYGGLDAEREEETNSQRT